jgi:hypothetical protein
MVAPSWLAGGLSSSDTIIADDHRPGKIPIAIDETKQNVVSGHRDRDIARPG